MHTQECTSLHFCYQTSILFLTILVCWDQVLLLSVHHPSHSLCFQTSRLPLSLFFPPPLVSIPSHSLLALLVMQFSPSMLSLTGNLLLSAPPLPPEPPLALLVIQPNSFFPCFFQCSFLLLLSFYSLFLDLIFVHLSVIRFLGFPQLLLL